MKTKKLATTFAVLSVASFSGLTLAACLAGPPSDSEPDSEPDSEELRWGPAIGRFCGGFGAIPCPPRLTCVDDPRDNCDPDRGGRDCGGICVPGGTPCDRPGRRYVSRDPAVCAATQFQCAWGLVQFYDECGCGCEPSRGVEPCGADLCRPHEFCCNPSCGICAPKGGACIQIACD